ncbi:hypothetical protein CLM62_21885 [Streptomyces sp. SA15]|uniref:hypothetical protein n=1 Tax=Streptomyces sp. SA15 TaxID=934019 RepID=UPI000BAF73FB|nr:hypothetical protein [Streptomyces sp. SA15]PAZ14094.1 hypothetical protein CLM62_21885 [Streptomyces sp. SA15]
MLKNIARASLATTAALAFMAAAAGTASAADKNTSNPRSDARCSNPLLILSPGTKIDGSRCSSVTVLHQEIDKNNSNNTSVLSALFGHKR